MLRLILKCFFSAAVLAALTMPSYAQNKPKKKISYGDTIQHKFFPTGVRFGVDAIGLIKDKATKNWRGWEASADIDFWRYFLTAEVGNWSRHEILANGTYSNNGNYFRIGGDFNFMLKEHEKNMFFLGFRYGTSYFSENVNYNYDTATVTGFPTTEPKIDHNSGLTAHWIELTSGFRVRIWGPFWMGYLVRIKFPPSIKGAGTLHPFDVPGYGIAEKSNYWGINYQLMFRMPLRKRK